MHKETRTLILRELKNDKEGFYHLILYTFSKQKGQKEKDVNLKWLLREISDNTILRDAIADLAEETSITTCKKELGQIVQNSLQKLLLSGCTSYKFISVVSSMVDNKWLNENFSSSSPRKFKVLCFFHLIEPILLEPATIISKSKRNKIVSLYKQYSKKPSKKLISLLEANEKILLESDETLIRELKSCF